MSEINIYCLPGHAATGHAGRFLQEMGVPVSFCPVPGATHWLLPVPTRVQIHAPDGVTIIGGNLDGAGIDLLKDPFYLAENAAITARCALGLIGRELKDLSVLILGWGRIGKCLGRFLRDAGAHVAVAVRNPSDAAMLRALGYEGIFLSDVPALLHRFGAILNTVPVMVLDASGCREDCVLLELASRPGMSGTNIIDGRGLPGGYAPEESGQLIARTVLRLIKEDKA